VYRRDEAGEQESLIDSIVQDQVCARAEREKEEKEEKRGVREEKECGQTPENER
jgi:hypothetical protein